MTETKPHGARGGWKTHAALLVVQVAFASQAVEGKIAMGPRVAGGEALAPFAVAMVRMLGGALFFQLFARASGQLVPTTRRDHAWLGLLSVLGIVLNQTLFLIGLRVTTPMAAALLGITIPVMTAGIAVALRHERASVRATAGTLLAAGGVVWLTLDGRGGGFDRGALVIVANCLSYSFFIVLSRKIILRLGAVTVITWVFTWGALLFFPFGIHALVTGAAEWTARGWGFLGYIVVVPTIIAYLANAWALGRTSASMVTIYIYVQPIITAFLAWAQLGHTLSGRIVAASILIAIGVAFVSTRRAIPVVTRG